MNTTRTTITMILAVSIFVLACLVVMCSPAQKKAEQGGAAAGAAICDSGLVPLSDPALGVVCATIDELNALAPLVLARRGASRDAGRDVGKE